MQFATDANGKQEVFWAQIEGRLLPMLEGVADLKLGPLNEATQAWVEMEYNRKLHSELGRSPLQCYLHDKDVGRPAPASEQLRLTFTAELRRRVRRSDSLGGRRFELPARFGHFEWITARLAAWDLSQVHLSDPNTGVILARLYPQDKARNALGQRAVRAWPLVPPPGATPPACMAPLLQKLIQQYATTGLPPAYLPKDELSTPTPTQ
ncbi:MAG: hypothetical protein HYS67_01820 [Deltaproteobacteria bacterium]|nr:hypothetical protein [Deltaproteobacteria bacterium]